MKNRWNIEVRPGAAVTYSLSRGGHADGTVASLEKTGPMANAYGVRVILADGASCGLDDVSKSDAVAPRAVLELSQWESRVAELYSMARLCKMSHPRFMERRQAQVLAELTRKYGGKRAVYSAYVHGYVSGLMRAHDAALYRYHLEFCYLVDGVLYATGQHSETHRLTDEFYSTNRGHLLSSAPSGHYWKGSDVCYFGHGMAPAGKDGAA